jgi:DNA-binding response OmpR family regulator
MVNAPEAARPLLRTDPFLLLIADADPDGSSRLADILAEHQVTAVVCTDGAEALIATGAEHPDAVLATASLPTIGGAALTRAISARTSIPVVVGIGDADGAAAAEALAAGATACVAHPYRLRELLPILRAIRPEGLEAAHPPLEVGGLRLDAAALEVTLHGRLVRMPLRELRLLHLLMTEQIRGAIWGEAPGSNTITVHVQRLRHRLGDDQDHPKLILTVRGVGYRLVPPVG